MLSHYHSYNLGDIDVLLDTAQCLGCKIGFYISTNIIRTYRVTRIDCVIWLKSIFM